MRKAVLKRTAFYLMDIFISGNIIVESDHKMQKSDLKSTKSDHKTLESGHKMVKSGHINMVSLSKDLHFYPK